MTIRNPVIPGFHPDPSICRIGDEYFLAASSFTWFPGVPIFRSANLTDWTQIGNVLDRVGQLDLSRTDGWSSLGVYAPTLRHHSGRFWLVTTIVDASGVRSLIVTADRAWGPWSDPIPIALPGIDPDIAWDGDGNCWIHSSTGGQIVRCRADPLTGRVLDEPEPTWSGTGLQYPEAPHLFFRSPYWYLLIAEGGTEAGHAVSIARASRPTGPWTACPANPILSHRSTDHPIQHTGHGDMVEAADGRWWMVLLGVRLRGMTPGFHVLGRETFLAPVEWEGGWPVVPELELLMERDPGGTTLAAEGGRTAEGPRTDDFDAPKLNPEWVARRRDPADLSSLDERPGWLTFTDDSGTLDSSAPAFIGRRQVHHHCRVTTRVDVHGPGEAGLALVMDETAHYEVAVRADQVVVKARIGPLQSEVASSPRPPGQITLRLETTPGGFGPDQVSLGFETDAGEYEVLAELDGRYLSTQVAGGFTGRLVGMYAVECEAAFDWFEYTPLT